MSTTTEAIMRGVRRGFTMAMTPDPTRLRELSEAASSTDYTAEAWTSVGADLRTAMDEIGPAQSSTPSR